jgi:hypothetical protein
MCSTPLAPGAACQTGQACVAWYPDCDKDNYGNPSGTPVYSCSSPSGAPACPAGFNGQYIANKTDCCDTDANAFPNQTAYFTVQTACGATTQSAYPYDFNCDQIDEQQSNGPAGCTTGVTCSLSNNNCTLAGMPADCNGEACDYYQGDCGATWNMSCAACTLASDLECIEVGGSGPGGTQACH